MNQFIICYCYVQINLDLCNEHYPPTFNFLDFITISIITLHLSDFSNGAILSGPCKNAKTGGVYESCSMKCEWNGKCVEMVQNERCSCDGKAIFTSITKNFKVHE